MFLNYEIYNLPKFHKIKFRCFNDIIPLNRRQLHVGSIIYSFIYLFCYFCYVARVHTYDHCNSDYTRFKFSSDIEYPKLYNSFHFSVIRWLNLQWSIRNWYFKLDSVLFQPYFGCFRINLLTKFICLLQIYCWLIFHSFLLW